MNTLNPKNLKECSRLWRIRDENKSFLTREHYTFDEFKLLSATDYHYIQLYHQLTYQKVDNRLACHSGGYRERVTSAGNRKRKVCKAWGNLEPKVVQSLLGHSSISITLNIYTHVLDNMMNEEIQKL